MPENVRARRPTCECGDQPSPTCPAYLYDQAQKRVVERMADDHDTYPPGPWGAF